MVKAIRSGYAADVAPAIRAMRARGVWVGERVAEQAIRLASESR
ncbi:MAG: DUF3368 domain-containing protein [Armatimonadetes bacterium]|nr:DUF3368 domain-containing protein [Armatimonadota bacterium]